MMTYKPFEQYLRREIGIGQNQTIHQDFDISQVETQFQTSANLALAGGSRLEFFLWKAVPQLTDLDNSKVRNLIIEHYIQQGYTLVKKEFEDVDFELNGVKYFASFDLFPQMLKFSFDRQIDFNNRL